MPVTAARRVGGPVAAGGSWPGTVGVAWGGVMAASWWARGGRSTQRERSAGALARLLHECDTRFHAGAGRSSVGREGYGVSDAWAARGLWRARRAGLGTDQAAGGAGGVAVAPQRAGERRAAGVV